jgi:ribosomal protein S18 acetylase RimI-like enzyme
MGAMATFDVEIRAATDDDFEAMVELDQASAEHHAAIDPVAWEVPDRAGSAEFLRRRRAEDPGRETLVATVEGRVVGMVEIAIVTPGLPGGAMRRVPSADVGIAVLPQFRNRGIGKQLMQAAETWAREHGAERMILDLSAANEGARRLYKRLGYEVYGLQMRRSLREGDGRVE